MYVHDVPLTDNALVHLKELPRLTVLSLQNTKIRGAGLAFLRSHAKLRVVNLSGTEVGDDARFILPGWRSWIRWPWRTARSPGRG